jgi:hypothetical protein
MRTDIVRDAASNGAHSAMLAIALLLLQLGRDMCLHGQVCQQFGV